MADAPVSDCQSVIANMNVEMLLQTGKQNNPKVPGSGTPMPYYLAMMLLPT